MPQLAVAAVGAAIGSAVGGTFLGVAASTIGWTVGSIVGSLLFAPDGPKAQLQDTRAAKLQFGAKIPRVRGRARLPMNPRWQSEWRPESQEVGGKGGGGGEVTNYSADGLFWVCEGIDGATGVRLWHNGKLVWSSLANSDDASLIASSETTLFSEILFHDGNAAQLPWPVFEAAVGTDDADGHRGLFCVSLENFQAGQSPNWGLLEVEFVEAWTGGATAALTLLQSRFLSNADDESAYANGAPAIDGAPAVGGGAALFEYDPGSLNRLRYPVIYPNGVDALVCEAIIDWEYTANVTSIPAIEFNTNIAFANPHMFVFYGDAGQLRYDIGGVGNVWAGFPSYPVHVALVIAASSLRLYVGGALVYTGTGSIVPALSGVYVIVGDSTTSGPSKFSVNGFRVRQEETYTGSSFASLSVIPPPDGSLDTVTPITVDLEDVMDGEMLRCGLTAAQSDNSELAGIDVTGWVFTSSGRDSAEGLAAWYHFGATCRDKLYTRLRGGASVVTIPFLDTGHGVGQPGKLFAGVDRGNDKEVPAYWVVSTPDIENNYETGTEDSPRIVTSSVERRQVQLQAVATPQERKGRATAFAVDAEVGSHRGTVFVGDEYAQLEPFDVFTAIDQDGNSHRLRAMREAHAQGVKALECVKDDAAALPYLGNTASPYSPSFTVAAAGTAEFLPLDVPLLREADNDAGYLAASKTSDTSTARWFESPDNVTHTPVATINSDATFGTVTAVEGAFATGPLFDEGSSITADLGTGAAPTSTTRAALLADRHLNGLSVGVNGRQVLGQFRTATLVGGTVWKFTGLLNMGAKDTARWCSEISVGDDFCLLGAGGVKHIPRSSAQLGVPLWVKAVPTFRAPSTVPAVAFTNSGEAVKPRAPVQLRAARDHATGDVLLSASRCTRFDTRFGGDMGDSCPLGEAIDVRRWRLYTDATFTTLLRTLPETGNNDTATYTAAMRATDGHSLYDPLFVEVVQVSDLAGEGYPLQDAA